MSLVHPSPALSDRKGALGLSAAFADALLIAIVIAALSMLRTGYVFGIENNLFHLPIVASLPGEPQYQGDAFMQSLRFFASGIWVLLDNTQKYLGNTELLFLVLDYLSRLLTFVGFLACASLLGVVTRRDKIVFSLILCSIGFLDGYTHAGTGGLFVNYFTHSEIANGTALLAIYFAARGRFTAAAFTLGITFFVNAFVAVWIAPLLVVIAISLLLKGETSFAALSSRTLLGLLFSAPIVYPALHSILANPEFGKPLAFDYLAYLHEYFAGHSVIDAIALKNVVGAVAVAVLGAAAFWGFGADARELKWAYLAALAIYLAGIVAPYLSGSPFVLNLQLLRAGTIFYLLAGLAVAALATNWLRDDRSAMFLPGCFVVLALGIQGTVLLFAAPIILLLQYQRATPEVVADSHRSIGYAALAGAALVLFPLSVWENIRVNRLYTEAVAEWTDLGNWARNATPLDATFIVPPKPAEDAAVEPIVIALSRGAVFEFVSHRRVWVDYKRGAAAMWTPSYYPIWHIRMTDLAALDSHAARLAYAARNGIGYIVSLCATLPAQSDVVFRTPHLCVSAVRRQAEKL
ncbi:hypothetical protein JQ596_04575 [Bradyrhizobium manausense]|uniref:DUF6798 domain-containing protein n=1 Tax=Bradyrhizobium TaxID=374 RepID=UPI001BAD3506|nr:MULTISPECIES: DUF6798 domain-containing protein [Bradyrhizobium]MBR0824802.1 hypothetical protein [Bradyrhizobium manausense]UVO29420.1 hypothetical protein KUF59_01200 [Bradyrhizobium arachidis]